MSGLHPGVPVGQLAVYPGLSLAYVLQRLLHRTPVLILGHELACLLYGCVRALHLVGRLVPGGHGVLPQLLQGALVGHGQHLLPVRVAACHLLVALLASCHPEQHLAPVLGGHGAAEVGGVGHAAVGRLVAYDVGNRLVILAHLARGTVHLALGGVAAQPPASVGRDAVLLRVGAAQPVGHGGRVLVLHEQPHLHGYREAVLLVSVVVHGRNAEVLPAPHVLAEQAPCRCVGQRALAGAVVAVHLHARACPVVLRGIHSLEVLQPEADDSDFSHCRVCFSECVVCILF